MENNNVAASQAAKNGFKQPNSKENRAYKVDSQPFDEMRIRTVPRYKTSGLSGDEWRISAVIEFYRNGNLVHSSESYRNVETAVRCSGWEWGRACDDGHALFIGESSSCDQEGCKKLATIKAVLKRGFHRDGSDRPLREGGEYRLFCGHHSTRGDAALEDADRNYYKTEIPKK